MTIKKISKEVYESNMTGFDLKYWKLLLSSVVFTKL
jgi:hypothetical protein